ncbi:Protein R11F4.3 [Dirofilaria immitis]|nr:Protein R11F4.3 [Dirofilaria immitis]
MKECISEQDHHRIFSPKQYSFDEECDLAEVNGDEFAYCLCRKNLCNLKTIIDQFIDFEESHPEIFVTTNDDKHEHDEQFQIPTRDSRQLNYSSIRNIHQMEASVHYETIKPVSSDKKSNDNIGQSYFNYGNIHSTPRKIYDISHFSVQMNTVNGKFMASKPTVAFVKINQQNAEENENYCYSCTENLNDPTKDCLEPKIVQCPISKLPDEVMCVSPNNYM